MVNTEQITRTVHPDRIQYTNAKGNAHRLDGPAIIYTDGAQFWYTDGTNFRQLHGTVGNGRADIEPDGAQYWYSNGYYVGRKYNPSI